MGNMRMEELLPLLLMGNQGGGQQNLLPLLLLMNNNNNNDCESTRRSRSSSCTATTTSDSGDGDDSSEGFPADFADYLSSLVGEQVRVSCVSNVDNALILVGCLVDVGADFIILENVTASGVFTGYHEQLGVLISNILGISTVPFYHNWLPLLGQR